ncbi:MULTISPECIES: RNA polymerase sigma factor SigW [Paenibacillus]|jgi:RNA polymerase sigma-70 factor (ECF subfamily)|uniref:RNA polymerase sigma factor SigW n=2 Tax=Paenibacillus barengoltzii TaxID=343517 RepID=R9LK38_9BACL|nr:MULTISPECIES: RNA polymerase sigma factor SigW [Paenibacillus]EOS58923.1 RNA polymerase sigma-W factor [Paenibacillus barengoltzii G22]MDU0330947.1 RNA polymerase sigma factor SigW [Paenibacillus sp. 3LSP]MEC2343869.1 RNA polymerase sigma factor SigW [Paenibacillus barengoltzii]SMF12205.1 RNA polymerase sigma-70 factor, ECF subfamily [Paenibacillus barengoltzii]SMF41992.1 RNA polymerase sigma-70 factor, ECF subfamily [Paenibacillus barengoltzii J12]
MVVEHFDARLVKLARKGDQGAFAELVDLYKDKLYHLGYRMLSNRHEAEDVVQETFLRVHKNWNRYDDKQKFSTWIYRIATNLCIDRLRKRKPSYYLDAEMNDQDGLDGYTLIPGDERTPETEYLLSETQQTIHQAIEGLPAKYKSVIVLRYLQELSLQEISEVLDMPVTTVKTRVHRGREFLRKKLEHKML